MTDGVVDFRTTYSASYDKHGNLIAETNEDDYGADGVIDARATASTPTTSKATASPPPTRRITTATASSTSRVTGSSTYDKKGNPLTFVFDQDDNADGVIDVRTTSARSYDDKGNLIAETDDID